MVNDKSMATNSTIPSISSSVSSGGGRGRWGSDRLNRYTEHTLSLVGLFTLVCMGFWCVRYIGLDYRNRYCDPIKARLSDSRSRVITTLILCIVETKIMYEQCVDHKVKMPSIGVLS